MTGTTAITIAAIAAAGSLAAAGVNAASQAHANKKNIDLMHEQMAYQTGEREATQEYNTPVNQRNRFEQAGINPYMALGNIDAGNTTAQTAPGAPQVQAVDYGSMLNGLTDGLKAGQDWQNMENMQLGIEQAKVDARYKLTEKLLELNEQYVRIEGMNIDNDSKKQQLQFLGKQMTRLQQDIDFTNASWNDQLATIKANRRVTELQGDMLELQKEFQKIVNDRQAEVIQAGLDEARSRIKLNNASSAAQIASAALSYAQEKGVKIDNAQKNKMNWMIRQGLMYENKIKKYQASHPSRFESEVIEPLFHVINKFHGASRNYTDLPEISFSN